MRDRLARVMAQTKPTEYFMFGMHMETEMEYRLRITLRTRIGCFLIRHKQPRIRVSIEKAIEMLMDSIRLGKRNPTYGNHYCTANYKSVDLDEAVIDLRRLLFDRDGMPRASYVSHKKKQEAEIYDLERSTMPRRDLARIREQHEERLKALEDKPREIPAHKLKFLDEQPKRNINKDIMMVLQSAMKSPEEKQKEMEDKIEAAMKVLRQSKEDDLRQKAASSTEKEAKATPDPDQGQK